jgi:DNA primase
MATEWVDFKKIKEAVDIQMVLGHYGITGLTKSGDELRGPCPIHKSSQRSKNFTVNIRKNAFKCFSEGCGARGNVLDLVTAMEHCSVREAALKLQEWFKVGESESAVEMVQIMQVSPGEIQALELHFAEVNESASKLGDAAMKGLALVAEIKNRQLPSVKGE